MWLQGSNEKLWFAGSFWESRFFCSKWRAGVRMTSASTEGNRGDESNICYRRPNATTCRRGWVEGRAESPAVKIRERGFYRHGKFRAVGLQRELFTHKVPKALVTGKTISVESFCWVFEGRGRGIYSVMLVTQWTALLYCFWGPYWAEVSWRSKLYQLDLWEEGNMAAFSA
jgi:hypothetical protein